MTARIAQRLGFGLLSMFALSIVVFGLVRLTGDPVELLLGELATEADFIRVRTQLGLDRPLLDQYLLFVGNVLQGDLGTSLRMRVPVAEMIAQRFPATLLLTCASLLIALSMGIVVGVLCAKWRGSPFDRIARTLAALGQSTPAFWVGLMLVLVFAIQMRLVPAGGYGGLDALILPAVAMALHPTAALVRLVRTNMLEVLNTDYVKFLRIKGLPERSVIWKHAFRNAALSTLTFAGIVTASMLTGSVVIETVFVWPGMGLLMIQSIEGRDFAVTQALVLVFSLIYLVVNLVVDILYTLLNPRLRK